jgi:hypothetical protein
LAAPCTSLSLVLLADPAPLLPMDRLQGSAMLLPLLMETASDNAGASWESALSMPCTSAATVLTAAAAAGAAAGGRPADRYAAMLPVPCFRAVWARAIASAAPALQPARSASPAPDAWAAAPAGTIAAASQLMLYSRPAGCCTSASGFSAAAAAGSAALRAPLPRLMPTRYSAPLTLPPARITPLPLAAACLRPAAAAEPPTRAASTAAASWQSAASCREASKAAGPTATLCSRLRGSETSAATAVGVAAGWRLAWSAESTEGSLAGLVVAAGALAVATVPRRPLPQAVPMLLLPPPCCRSTSKLPARGVTATCSTAAACFWLPLVAMAAALLTVMACSRRLLPSAPASDPAASCADASAASSTTAPTVTMLLPPVTTCRRAAAAGCCRLATNSASWPPACTACTKSNCGASTQ